MLICGSQLINCTGSFNKVIVWMAGGGRSWECTHMQSRNAMNSRSLIIIKDYRTMNRELSIMIKVELNRVLDKAWW